MIVLLPFLCEVIDATHDPEMIRTKPAIFVKFFAPWCSHCMHMQPAYIELSESFGESIDDMDQLAVTIAQVDCTQNNVLCQQHGIGAYPTLVLFRSGQRIAEFGGDRTYEQMDKWIRQTLGMKQKESDPEQDPIDATMNFTQVVAQGHSMVKFFAPWCSHCVQMKPAYAKLAGKFNDRVKVIEVDCTRTELCNQLGIRAYPTMVYYKDGKKMEEYQGDHSAVQMGQFLEQKLQEVQMLQDVKIEDIGSNFKIIQEGWHFVKFYAPWCSHCNDMQPEYIKLAHQMKNQPVNIWMVDCTKAPGDLCQRQGITGYPTLTLFKDGEIVGQYDSGHRSAPAMKQFIQTKLEEQQIAQLPSLVQDATNSLPQLIKDKPIFVTFCINNQMCSTIKPIVNKMADTLKDTELIFGWVNCEKNRNMCAQYGVGNYPTMTLYENGDRKGNYQGQADESSIRMWLLVNSDFAV
ncbi:Protein_disulfide isomerase PDI3 [Hexamita inflata]|uniref:Protein disulfide isomerase PDI3 n=1 Tax=Hexamita inflata TaxID=28002 RepID=A0AA86PIS1_9EUKA|nr:Protein disulfide isomerase PDI3 [Hexamita inflata]CAI9939186.1 Protein disulfide isomerase PDI3 [Hexamita inflata]